MRALLLLLVAAVAVLVVTLLAAVPAAAQYSTARYSSGYYFRLHTSTRRLEVRPSSSSTWGSMCDDYMSTQTANVLCSILSLGDRGAYDTSSNVDMYSSAPIWLDNVRCNSGATSFSSCSYTTSHNCGHYEDIGLNCYYYSTGVYSGGWYFRLASNQRLEVRQSGQAFGTVCGSTYISTTTAGRLCYFMGYRGLSSGSIITSGVSGSSSQVIRMKSIYCSSLSTSFSSCSYSSLTSSCYHSQDIGLRCGTFSHTSTTPTSSSSSTSSVNPNIGVIIGASVGGFIGLIILGVVITFICAAAGASKSSNSSDNQFQMTTTTVQAQPVSQPAFVEQPAPAPGYGAPPGGGYPSPPPPGYGGPPPPPMDGGYGYGAPPPAPGYGAPPAPGYGYDPNMAYGVPPPGGAPPGFGGAPPGFGAAPPPSHQ